MANILISGPAGAGKSAEALTVRAEMPGPAIVLHFQELYASLLGLLRQSDGRYPRAVRHR